MGSRWVILALVVTGSRAVAQAADQGCTVPLLMRGPEGFFVELRTMERDQVRAIPPGGVPALVAPILPMGSGMSGDLVRAADRGVIAIRCTATEVRFSIRPLDGSDARELPALPLANYQRYELRVNVTDDRRQGVAFLIRDGLVERAAGPVLDMFQGRIPMAPGDVAITLETLERIPSASIQGTVTLRRIGPWPAVRVALPGGRNALFVLDLGASRTVIARTLLPGGTPLHNLTAVEHSMRGTRTLAASATGAGGAATAVARVADLAWIDLGALRVDSVRPLVMDEPMRAGPDTVWGILGLDVLRRARRLRGSFAAPTDTSVLTLGGPPLAGAVEIPVRRVQGLMVVEGKAGTVSLWWLLDSGSRISSVPEDVARREGWIGPGSQVDSLRGIDGSAFPSWPAAVPVLSLGSWQGPSTPFIAARIPVVATLGLTDPTGILGQPFFHAAGEIEIDLEKGVLRVRSIGAPR